MGKVRVSETYQITLPSDVRAARKVIPGETVTVEPGDEATIIVRLHRSTKDPLDVLIGKKPWFKKPLDQDELDEMGEDQA